MLELLLPVRGATQGLLPPAPVGRSAGGRSCHLVDQFLLLAMPCVARGGCWYECRLILPYPWRRPCSQITIVSVPFGLAKGDTATHVPRFPCVRAACNLWTAATAVSPCPGGRAYICWWPVVHGQVPKSAVHRTGGAPRTRPCPPLAYCRVCERPTATPRARALCPPGRIPHPV